MKRQKQTEPRIDWTTELQNYVRIDTSQPNVNYTKAIDFLIDLIKRLSCGLTYRIYIHNTYPILIVTKQGVENKSILLNSHMDVVNASNTEEWNYPPFSGYYDPVSDRIYGRGTQDMKSQGILYLAALEKLCDIQLPYTIHISFVPNEEIGSLGGMSEFVKTPEYQALNVQFAIDESCASMFNNYLIFYTERTIWQLCLKIRSEPAHAAMPLTGTCETKLRLLLDEIADFRRRNVKNIMNSSTPKIGYSTTINMTKINGGDLLNMLPREIDVYLDMRIGVNMDLDLMFAEIQRWLYVANDKKPPTPTNGISIEWIKKSTRSPETKLENSFCRKFLRFFEMNKIEHLVTVAPGSTDARFLRQAGTPTLGFTPIINTPPLLHANNEFIYKKQFLDSIGFFTNLIQYLSNNE